MARATNVTFEIDSKSMAQFLADLERLGVQAEKGTSIALRQEAEQMMDRADILVPVKTGALKSSRFIGLVHRWSRGLEIKFGYSSPYALYQHFGHYEHDDGRRLFLESPVKYSRRGLADRMRLVIARYLR